MPDPHMEEHTPTKAEIRRSNIILIEIAVLIMAILLQSAIIRDSRIMTFELKTPEDHRIVQGHIDTTHPPIRITGSQYTPDSNQAMVLYELNNMVYIGEFFKESSALPLFPLYEDCALVWHEGDTTRSMRKSEMVVSDGRILPEGARVANVFTMPLKETDRDVKHQASGVNMVVGGNPVELRADCTPPASPIITLYVSNNSVYQKVGDMITRIPLPIDNWFMITGEGYLSYEMDTTGTLEGVPSDTFQIYRFSLDYPQTIKTFKHGVKISFGETGYLALIQQR